MQPNANTQTDPLRQITERLGTANNVLVTVSNNPTVDQLAACIGLTLALNKQGKHATAVFSGKVPSTLEFLQPEHTIEKNTDSLRDFIISLDKAKADKLRYKVEDEFVKIFITPYRTSIDDKDLTFSQGDFNIDLIITLGVHERAHLDAAIVAHGRILHDATVVSLNTDTISEIGSINWVGTDASSLCEMTSDLVLEAGKELLDAQIATALLTGMVAETDRFGNEKARPHTMSVSGVLMAAGASTQLIANKLEEPVAPEPEPEPTPEEPADELPAVVDETSPAEESEQAEEQPTPEPEPQNSPTDGVIEIDHSQQDNIHIDEQGKLQAIKDLEDAEAALQAESDNQPPQSQSNPEAPAQSDPGTDNDSKMVLDPPQLGGQLTANSVPEYKQYSDTTDPLSSAATQAPLLDRTDSQAPADAPEQTLSDLERAVNSPHVQQEAEATASSEPVAPPPAVDDARAVVDQAVAADTNYRPEPLNAVGSTPIDLNLGDKGQEGAAQPSTDEHDETTPPPVPPPMMPPNN